MNPDKASNRRSCECCGSKEFGVVNAPSARYLKCTSCGHETQDCDSSSPHQFEIEQNKFYGEDSLYLRESVGFLQQERIRKRLAITQQFLKRGKILEIGPGSGHFAQALDERGYEVDLVEHSPQLAQRLREWLDVGVYLGDFSSLPLPTGRFDAVFSFHVIEHVTDMAEHLHQAARLIKPSGFLFLATPNAMSWEHGLMGRYSPNYSTAHISLFTRASVKLAIESAGLTVVKLTTPSYTESYLRIVTALLRAIRRDKESATRGTYAARIAGRQGRAFLRIAGALSAPVRFVQDRMQQGNELFVVARKDDAQLAT